ncbi:FxsA family protein [Anaerolineales bacterium HSG25]|nr:FxsA family protein [Anaerolineales bacterium HSG25]
MLARLLLLFIIVPMVELFLLIEIGQRVGTLPTLGLIMVTGFVGALLAKRQGMAVLKRIQTDSQAGRVPAESIFDGAMILVAGAFLMTPGILTDTFGFLCLFPPTRQFLKRLIWSQLQRMVQNGQIQFSASSFYQGGAMPRREPDNVIIIDPDENDDR